MYTGLNVCHCPPQQFQLSPKATVDEVYYFSEELQLLKVSGYYLELNASHERETCRTSVLSVIRVHDLVATEHRVSSRTRQSSSSCGV